MTSEEEDLSFRTVQVPELDPDWEVTLLRREDPGFSQQVQTRSSRARSTSFYEDDEAVECDLDAAVAAGAGGDRGHCLDVDAPAGYDVELGRRTSNQLKPNELRALSQGLLDAVGTQRRRIDSSDLEEECSGSEGDDNSGSDDENEAINININGSSHSKNSAGSGKRVPLGTEPLGNATAAFADRLRRCIPSSSSSSSGSSHAQKTSGSGSYAFASEAGLSLSPTPVTLTQSATQLQHNTHYLVPPPIPPPPVPTPALGTPTMAGGTYHSQSAHRRQSPHVARKIKILMLGDSGVGKTSLVQRFCEDSFQGGLVGTMGVDFKMRTEEVNGENVLVQVWDTAGQERFHKITHAYYRGSHGILLVYDMCDQHTLSNISYWMGNIRDNASTGVSTCLVGNKKDLRDKAIAAGAGGSPTAVLGTTADNAFGGGSRVGGIVVSPENARAVAERYGVAFFETSAKTGHNVRDAFMCLVDTVLRTQEGSKPPTPVGGSKRRRQRDRVHSSGSSAIGSSRDGGTPPALLKCKPDGGKRIGGGAMAFLKRLGGACVGQNTGKSRSTSCAIS